MVQPICLHFPINDRCGWGIFGLNLALHWASDPDLQLYFTGQYFRQQIGTDPVQIRALETIFDRSVALNAGFESVANQHAMIKMPVLLATESSFTWASAAHNVALYGTPSIWVTFFEKGLSDDAIDRAKAFPLVVTGSRFNEAMLRAYGITHVRTILQGVDLTLFRPGPRLGLFPDRFVVFSGGKAELRKGQDIVLAAFSRFARHHPEALLVTAWHSPYSEREIAQGLEMANVVPPVPFTSADKLDVIAWATANGIPRNQVMDLGLRGNETMPAILREMDVAVFPNRAEGGTNLVAMECMACGVPVILSRNTGHCDLIEGENCYTLDRQRPCPGSWHEFPDVPGWGWGESEVDEVVEKLEQVFGDRAEAMRRGGLGAQTISRLTWSRTAAEMKKAVLEVTS